MGISVVPMPFMIDGETYFEDITLTQEEFYHRLERNADISTSQPSPETVTKLWDHLLSDHDQVVHIPMSSGLPAPVKWRWRWRPRSLMRAGFSW